LGAMAQGVKCGLKRQWKLALICEWLATGAPGGGQMAAPAAQPKKEPFSKGKWRERRGSNPRPSA
jgi:hypothetical protein